MTHFFPSNFFFSNTPSYGNCYTFNSALSPRDGNGGQRATSLTGPEYGLVLTFGIEQEKYAYDGMTKQVFLFLRDVLSSLWKA